MTVPWSGAVSSSIERNDSKDANSNLKKKKKENHKEEELRYVNATDWEEINDIIPTLMKITLFSTPIKAYYGIDGTKRFQRPYSG